MSRDSTVIDAVSKSALVYGALSEGHSALPSSKLIVNSNQSSRSQITDEDSGQYRIDMQSVETVHTTITTESRDRWTDIYTTVHHLADRFGN